MNNTTKHDETHWEIDLRSGLSDVCSKSGEERPDKRGIASGN